jgi:hypothetical protein
MTQFTIVFSTVDGNVLDCDSLTIVTIVEEDGELKILEVKDFADPEKRAKFHGWVAGFLAKGGLVA